MTKRASRLFRVVSAAALLISMLAATVAPAAAQQDAPSSPAMDTLFSTAPRAFVSGANTTYYPWVANDDNFGLGAADTRISVQNLEDRDSQIWIYVGNGSGGFDLVTTAYLSAYASKTFTAGQLGIASGDGAPVAVVAANLYTAATPWNVPAALGVPAEAIDSAPGNALFLLETPISLSNPITANDGGGETTQVVACIVNYHTSAQPGLGTSHGYVAAVTHDVDGTTYAAGDWVPGPFTQAELQEILNAANADNDDDDELVNPFGGLNADGDCGDMVGRDSTTYTVYDAVAIGGVAKMAVEGEMLPMTTGADTAVSGYNALNGLEVSQFNEWYLPIVQTNCGPGGCWDSTIRVANLSALNSAITIRFFPADDGSGSLQTGFQVQELVNGGDTWNLNLGDLVPDGWVGSAHIYSDGWTFAMVDRYKVGYNMWITNTGSAANFERGYWDGDEWVAGAQVPGANGRYALFAPHVLMDWYGWNTGINVANLVNQDNNISIQYFNMFGNATQVLNQRLAAHGMTYFYDPNVAAQNNSAQDVQTDPNAGVVGSAIIWSDHPVAAAVDATKYPETDPRGGVDLFQATSYNATGNVFTWQAFPLVQKGNPADGMGATSGINIMNPNPQAAVANAYWVNPSGFLADNFGVSSVSIPGFANGFIYTLWQHNLPNGFIGAAQVISNVPVVAVSANVDYQVDGDGSAIFNSFNPCGLYRTPDLAWNCFYGDPFDTSGRSVTKFFVDEDGDPIQGVNFYIIGDNPDFPFQRSGVSGPDGSRTFTNVPVGTYDLYIDSLPVGYTTESGELGWQESFTINQGDDLEITNTLIRLQYEFTKVVLFQDTEVPVAGINVVIWEWTGETVDGVPVVTNLGSPNINTTTNADGEVTVDLYPGQYVLCKYDADAVATYVNPIEPDTEIEFYPDLQASADLAAADCETFTMPFADYEIDNDVWPLLITKTVLDDDGEPVESAVVTIVDIDGAIAIDLEETTGADGTATFNVPAGDYELCSTIQVSDGGEGTIPFTICEEIEVVAGTENAEVNTHSLATITKVVTLDGDAVEGAEVLVTGADNDFDGSGTTDENGEASFTVPPGAYVVCSAVTVDMIDGATTDQQFVDLLCEDDDVVVAAGDDETITNPHVTRTVIKTVESQLCEDFEETVVCTDFAPVEDADVTVEFNDTIYEFTTGEDGSVTVLIPGDETVDIRVCSEVSGNVICESTAPTGDNGALTFVGGVATALNQHTVSSGGILGQIDILNTADATRPPADAYICLQRSEGEDVWQIVGESFDDCLYVPMGDFDQGYDAYFFSGVPSGTYRLLFYVPVTSTWPDWGDEALLWSNEFDYSVVVDNMNGGLQDIENDDNAPVGRGEVEGLPDFTHNLLFVEPVGPFGQMDFGFGVWPRPTPAAVDYEACLYKDSINPGDLNENLVGCVQLGAEEIAAHEDGWFYTNVLSGTYYLRQTYTFDSTVYIRTSGALTYSVVDDFSDGFLADIEGVGVAQIGELANSGAQHDFYIPQGAESGPPEDGSLNVLPGPIPIP